MALKFHQAEAQLRGKEVRRINANTKLVRLSQDCIAVRYHNTDVVKVSRNNQYQIDNGGYETKTTKDRINEYSPAQVYQEKREWFFFFGADKLNRNIKEPFERGAVFNAKGKRIR